MSKKELAAKLDKYYTKESTAKVCYEKMCKYLADHTLEASKHIFIEPSAGNGRFLNVIDEEVLGFDLEPEDAWIQKMDFLLQDAFETHIQKLTEGKKLVFIGNPPFGTRGKLAVAFLNKALRLGYAVGFVVPIQFRKWSIQSKINQDASLVADMTLPEDAFTFLDKDYSLRCCFQIWTLLCPASVNLRIAERPPVSHPDFTMYQYNRTVRAEKYFDADWDFAVPRQGWCDYTFKAYSPEDCDRKLQWIFFKAKNQRVLKKLLAIDFVKLSKKNSRIPGFGKADVIEEYE